MKKINKQNQNFQKLVNDNSIDGVVYRKWITRNYKEYKEEVENRSVFNKVLAFFFGDPNIIGKDLVNDFGKHNLDTLLK